MVIAPLGQIVIQCPQAMQPKNGVSLTFTFPSESVKPKSLQTSTHVPQPLHLSVAILISARSLVLDVGIAMFCYIIRLIFATNQGVTPMKTTTTDHKFPVVKSYAFNNSLKLSPIVNPKIVSKGMVKAIHKIPTFQYVIGSPFPIRGINTNETIKISKQSIIPLRGSAKLSPIQEIRTTSRNPPFKMARGMIDNQIKIDFLIIFIHFSSIIG